MNETLAGKENVNTRHVMVAEVMTVAVLFATALIFARPELEGWSIFDQFRTTGVWSSFQIYWHNAPTRWLEPAPLALAWLLGHGRGWAVGLVYGLLITAKFGVVRWAVSPFVHDRARWVLSTLGAVMVPWTGGWHSHNMAQQLSALFLIIGFASLTRCSARLQLRWIAVTVISVFLSLATYEALLFCTFLIPPTVAILQSRRGFLVTVLQTLRLSIPIIGGVAVAAVVLGLILHFSGESSYQSRTIAGQDIIGSLSHRLRLLYETAYEENEKSLAFIVLFSGTMLTSTMQTNRYIALCIFSLLVLIALPLLSMLYTFSLAHVVDAERVTYPVGFGFFLLSIVILCSSSGWRAVLRRE